MTPTVPRLPGHVQAMLRCPVCRAPLNQSGDRLECRGPGCGAAFPVVDGVPVLINECRSVFSIADIAARRPSFYGTATRLRRRVGSHIPDVGANFVAKRNLMKLTAALRARRERPVVLVIGGSRLGPGMEVIAGDPAIQLVETDIMAGTRTMVVCDGHDIPFEDGAFDGVIIQAVLEHVADPYRVVDEIHRVLKDDGVVYAETPFMEQVHGGRYDFTRFTLLGHRRLFRRFVEIDSGAVAGPGTALAWSYLYFLMSFTSTRPTAAETRVSTIARSVAKGFARLSGAWLKQFDRYLLGRPSALDAASATYFFGRKSAEALSDRALIRLYRGSG